MPRVAFQMGVLERHTRGAFWQALPTLIRHNPQALGAYDHDCFHFHHLNRHEHQVVRKIGEPLAGPSAPDAMDDKLPAS